MLAATGMVVGHWVVPVLGPGGSHTRSTSETGTPAYPREAVDASGYRVRIPAPPRRIVSQYWSADEFLYAVVPPERLVAVSPSAFVRGASNLFDFTERFHPAMATDAERILRENPDLVIVSGDSDADLSSLLRSSGVAVYRMFIDFETLEQIEAHIRLMGYLTGEDERAREEALRFRAAIDHAKSRKPAGAAAPRVLSVGASFAYGAHTLFDDIVTTLGARNVASAAGLQGYDSVSSEQIARWNPEWIIAGADAGDIESTRQRLLGDPAIQLTEAGRRGQVLILDNRIFLPMSPLASRRVEAIAEVIWK